MARDHTRSTRGSDCGLRWIRRFFLSPYAPFLVCFLLCGFVVLVPRRPEMILYFTILGPWAFLLLLFVNLPFALAAFQKFRMTESKKRNHALEHGAIFFLRERHGPGCRVGGRASDSGFRLSGIREISDVTDAFEKLTHALADGHDECVVANRCGSMLVVAEGLGLTLLTVSAVAALLLGLGPKASGLLLLANFAAFALLRFPIGRWIQRRFPLSLDFTDPVIADIRPVKDRKFYEQPHTVFVSTTFKAESPDRTPPP